MPVIIKIETGEAADAALRQTAPQRVHALLQLLRIQLGRVNVLVQAGGSGGGVEVLQPVTPGDGGYVDVEAWGVRGGVRAGSCSVVYAVIGGKMMKHWQQCPWQEKIEQLTTITVTTQP